MKNVYQNKAVLPVILALMVISILSGITACAPGQKNESNGNNIVDDNAKNYFSDDEQLLNSTFRIDILLIRVIFDYYPEAGYVDCIATVNFTMRPGQQRPVVHFTPGVTNGQINSVLLNGQSLSMGNQSDIKIVDFEHSSQRAMEFQRDLPEGQTHTLEMTYRLALADNPYRFFSDVNDINGVGNEELFPTINTPHELARHQLTFRVHGEKKYQGVGSGLFQNQEAEGVQQWLLDTEREIASYTIMFVLMPDEDTIYFEREINGVEIRLLTYNVYEDQALEALSSIESILPEFENHLGAFPMPRGISIFLTGRAGGGMEYYGATITSLRALEHEIFHMYFGCSTITRTYRDSWMDEAITMWYLAANLNGLSPISDSYKSGFVGMRSPIQVGFDTRAYDEGARIMEAIAVALGGKDKMIQFLKYLHQNYRFAPFTTFQFLDYLQNYAGLDMKAKFINWLYYTGQSGSASQSKKSYDYRKLHEINMTPPPAIQDKYNANDL